MRPIIINLDPTSLLLGRVVERKCPSPLTTRRRQPQPHQMPPRLPRTRRIILIRRPGMQDLRIAQKLNIAHLQHHMQRHALTRLLQHLHRLLHLRRRLGHLTGFPPGLERLDEVGIPFTVHAPLLPLTHGLDIDHRLHSPLPLPLSRLQPTREVPNRLRQRLDDIRAFLLQDIKHLMHGRDVGFAALEGAGDAQEPDDVAVVGVEELTRGGAVDADAVDLVGVVADVFDVAEDVAVGVLGYAGRKLVGCAVHMGWEGEEGDVGKGGRGREREGRRTNNPTTSPIPYTPPQTYATPTPPSGIP